MGINPIISGSKDRCPLHIDLEHVVHLMETNGVVKYKNVLLNHRYFRMLKWPIKRCLLVTDFVLRRRRCRRYCASGKTRSRLSAKASSCIWPIRVRKRKRRMTWRTGSGGSWNITAPIVVVWFCNITWNGWKRRWVLSSVRSRCAPYSSATNSSLNSWMGATCNRKTRMDYPIPTSK